MILLVVVCTVLGHAGASPKERVMVKYKVKDGVMGERVKITDIKNIVDKTKDYQETLNIVETGPIITEETNSAPDYKKTATLMMGQLKKAARAGDLTMGDIVFYVVKEVVAESLGGVATSVLGLQSRSGDGDFSIMGTVLRAVAKVAQGGHC
eukprot:TRINITY_DN10514_c0_g1_i1.p1 TRINITY_DN10514_c0_g1~~TRINITY_DN10514_c0_g1_i1.p1  ORF type:complete len:152 (+),score=30.92 TRINITY_DN10514_c0_g1_i1:44-499(+)